MVSRWLSVCPSVCTSIRLLSICPYFRFRMINWVNINGFSPNSLCALILKRSGLGFLEGKFHQFLTVICRQRSIFSFPDDNFSKYQWIFTKLGVYIFMVEICFGIAHRQISSIFDSYLPNTCPYFHFWTITLLNINGFSPNLMCALMLVDICFVIAIFLAELSALNTSIFYFQDNNLSKSRFSPNLMCALILWSSALGLLIGKLICPQHNNWPIIPSRFIK